MPDEIIEMKASCRAMEVAKVIQVSLSSCSARSIWTKNYSKASSGRPQPWNSILVK